MFGWEFGGPPSLASHKFDLPAADLGQILLWCNTSCQATLFVSDPSLLQTGRIQNQGEGQGSPGQLPAKHGTDRDTLVQWQAVHSHVPRLWKAKQTQPKCCGTNLGPLSPD